jgi:excisionase family DNA binding protein
MPSDVMTVDELAEYLRLDRQTVYRKFRSGELPGVRIGKAIRFKRDVIDAWLRVMSLRWDPERREELRRWAEGFAKQRGIGEKDVMDAVRARRYGRRCEQS